MSESKEFRSASWEALQDSNCITGYAVVFDSYTALYSDDSNGIEVGEVIDRHALDDADLSDVVLRYNHAGKVLARTRNKSLKLTIDDHGLKVDADLSGSEEGRNMYEAVRSGLYDKMSFAFIVAKGGDEWNRTSSTRTVRRIKKLEDVSIVDFPAYKQTEVDARSKFADVGSSFISSLIEERDLNASKLSMLREEHLIEEDIELRRERGEHRLTEEILAVMQEYNESRSTGGKEVNLLDRMQELNIGERVRYLNEVELQRRDASADEIKAEFAAIDTIVNANKEQRNRIHALVCGSIPKSESKNANMASSDSIFKSTKKETENMSDELRNFYGEVVEKRAAGSTATMTNVIPSTVLDEYVVEKRPGAFLEQAKISLISHSGDLTLPIAKLQSISEHTENDPLTDNGFVPDKVTIQHKEYAFKTGYSDLGMTISAEQMERLVSDTLIESMMKKMDGICLSKVAGETYTDGTNAVKVTTAPTFANLMTVASYLGNDYIENAGWFMAPSTYFSWLISLTDNNGAPILDASKKIEDVALAGYRVYVDSNIPANVIYFGDASRIHLNYARSPEVTAWTDFDSNTQKFGVRAVAGAAVETGSFVKLYK